MRSRRSPGILKVLGDVLLDEAVMRVVLQVLEIGRIARDEIIHANDLVAFREEAVGQVTAEKSGTAGDECCFHKD